MAKRPIRMTAGDVAADGRLDESRTATAIWNALPITARAQTFCIFFGRTPASEGDECRAASGVNVVGRVAGDPTVFKKVRSGTTIKLEKGAA